MSLCYIFFVVLIQECNYGDVVVNLVVIEMCVVEVVVQGVKLILLQELYNGVYFCQYELVDEFDLVEFIFGFSIECLGVLVKKYGVVIVGLLFECCVVGFYYNMAVVFEKDGMLLGKYCKMYILDDLGFYEKFYFIFGDIGFKLIDILVGCLGVFVCWDQWYLEVVCLMVLVGVELLFYFIVIGWDLDDQQDEQICQCDVWVLSYCGYVVVNGVLVLSCNCVGYEVLLLGVLGIWFWGNSYVFGLQGEFIVEVGIDLIVLICDVDLQCSEYVCWIWLFLCDCCIDVYGDLFKCYID